MHWRFDIKNHTFKLLGRTVSVAHNHRSCHSLVELSTLIFKKACVNVHVKRRTIAGKNCTAIWSFSMWPVQVSVRAKNLTFKITPTYNFSGGLFELSQRVLHVVIKVSQTLLVFVLQELSTFSRSQSQGCQMVLGKKEVKNLLKAGSKSDQRRLKGGYSNILIMTFLDPKFGVLTPKFGRGPQN